MTATTSNKLVTDVVCVIWKYLLSKCILLKHSDKRRATERIFAEFDDKWPWITTVTLSHFKFLLSLHKSIYSHSFWNPIKIYYRRSMFFHNQWEIWTQLFNFFSVLVKFLQDFYFYEGEALSVFIFSNLTLADTLQDIHQTLSSRPNTQVVETNQRPARSCWQPRVWFQSDNQRENSCCKTTIVAPQ